MSDLQQITTVTGALKDANKAWHDSKMLAFDGLTWKPHLQRDDEPGVLHVHLAERLRGYVVDRLYAASAAGYEVHLVVERACLYDEAFLGVVGEVGGVVHLLGDEAAFVDGRDVMRALTDEQVRVSTETRIALGRRAMASCLESTNKNVKGRRFEALIAFLFSQTDGLRVVECNYRTETEELDIVLQRTEASSDRCWSNFAQPLIVVEAKNWQDRVPQSVVSALYGKVHPKPHVANLAFLVGMSGFTGDAEKQILRCSGSGVEIVPLSGNALSEWIEAEDPAEFLDAVVRRAMLD